MSIWIRLERGAAYVVAYGLCVAAAEGVVFGIGDANYGLLLMASLAWPAFEILDAVAKPGQAYRSMHPGDPAFLGSDSK